MELPAPALCPGTLARVSEYSVGMLKGRESQDVKEAAGLGRAVPIVLLELAKISLLLTFSNA